MIAALLDFLAFWREERIPLTAERRAMFIQDDLRGRR